MPEGWKTDPRGTNEVPVLFDLFTQPFRILGVEPTATNRQVQDAFAIAQENRVASSDEVFRARQSILEPSQRLLHELSYPIDSPRAEVGALYIVLSSNAPSDELLLFAERLGPLSRANYLAHIAASRPAETAVLRALVEAHASIVAFAVYESLKELRRTAYNPPPSLDDVSAGLQELQHIHARAAIAAYTNSEDSFEPVLACSLQILDRNNRYQINVLGSLLKAYHQSTRQQQSERIQQINSACQLLQTQSIQASGLQALAEALTGWTCLCRPLIEFEMHRGVREWDFEVPTELVRRLIANLTDQQQYEIALGITALSRNILSSIPAAVRQLDEDQRKIERLLIDAKMKPLEDLIEGFESNFDLLSQTLRKDGFGERSTGPAANLWKVFTEVVAATDALKPAEPWMLIRDLAIHIGRNVEDAEAASALLVGLLHYGEKVCPTPSPLNTIRDDLRRMSRKDQVKPSRPTKAHRKRTVWPIGLALGALCAVALYLRFDGRYWSWLPNFAKTLASSTAEEIEPQVGTGQHFSLGNIRYCRFQEERMRIMKENARGPEDIRAFNMLAVDYNSRCSDYFYQDSDVATVTAEIAANRQRLADEAMRIMSTWPGHTTVPGVTPPAK